MNTKNVTNKNKQITLYYTKDCIICCSESRQSFSYINHVYLLIKYCYIIYKYLPNNTIGKHFNVIFHYLVIKSNVFSRLIN